jgi:hypothetical protein
VQLNTLVALALGFMVGVAAVTAGVLATGETEPAERW